MLRISGCNDETHSPKMPPQEIERQLDGEELMPLVRRPDGAQRLFALSVKSAAQGNKNSFLLVETDTAFPFKVQADFNAVRMKTTAPIEFLMCFEVVPLETHARAAHAAMQMPPTVANRTPHRTFRERRHDAFQRRRWSASNCPTGLGTGVMCHLTCVVQISCRGHSKKGSAQVTVRKKQPTEGGQN